jgi:hypothetical protein
MTYKETKDKIKRQLWMWGHATIDVSDVPGVRYDLLVDRTSRVIIMPYKDKSKETSDQWDVVAKTTPIKGKQIIQYAKKDWILNYNGKGNVKSVSTPRLIFPRVIKGRKLTKGKTKP